MKKEIDRISQINEQQVTTVLDGVSENVMSKIYKEWVVNYPPPTLRLEVGASSDLCVFAER
jgi:hypothetical protein